MRNLRIVILILTLLTAIVGPVYIWMTWIYAPPEETLLELIRILFQHTSPALIAYLAFGTTLVCAVMYLWKQEIVYDVVGAASVKLGLLFTTITLFSGMIWANAYWNTPWNWDPRETTTLVLWIAYACLLVYRASINDREVRARFGSVFGVVAFPAVLLSYISVHVWSTLHPIVITTGGLQMGMEHGLTLMMSLLAVSLLYFVLLEIVYRVDTAQEKIMQMRMERS